MRALYMSGYAGAVLARQGQLAGDCEFLQKPFTPPLLAAKVSRSRLENTLVGVGSVGTRAFVVLLQGRDEDSRILALEVSTWTDLAEDRRAVPRVRARHSEGERQDDRIRPLSPDAQQSVLEP